MNKLFFGIVAVALLTLLVTPVFAETFPVDAGPGNQPPQIYLLYSYYDICGDNGEGGSRPYIPTTNPTTGQTYQDAQTNGCIALVDNEEIRFDEYAFTGEQIGFLVAVRDLNGAEDIGYTYFTVNGVHEMICNDVTSELSYWCGPGYDVVDEHGGRHCFEDQIPAKPFAPAGFNEETDKLFTCLLTVEPNYYGESTITIDTKDIAGESALNDGIAQTWFFNPAIIVDLGTNDGNSQIGFEYGFPGQTVMSTNKLVVTNLAEGGVDLWAFIAADDLTDITGVAKCPVSNVLDTDTQMEFRCKIGTFEDDNWDLITNKDTSDSCGWHWAKCVRDHSEIEGDHNEELWKPYVQCLGALPLLYEDDVKITERDLTTQHEHDWECVDPSISIIKNQASAECQFRLTYPVPCIGDFTQGNFHIIVRAL